MKMARHMAAQGDTLFRRVDAIPASAKKQPRDEVLVVAHSETGHHHVIRSPEVELFSDGDPLVSFLRMDCDFADVEHLRTFDTHETLRLRGEEGVTTFFEVRRQREHVPDGRGREMAWTLASE